MKRSLHIIVSCADRKVVAVDERLRIRAIKAREANVRFNEWVRRLEAVKRSCLFPAATVYGGHHWTIASDLPTIAAARDDVSEVRLWVCSAGYGLLAGQDLIAGYGATFAKGVDDYVGVDGSYWWRWLSLWDRADSKGPRSVAGLVRSDPRALFIVCASKSYVDAMAQDLEEASHEIADPSRLMVFSGGSYRSPAYVSLLPIECHLMPVQSRLRNITPGRPLSRGVVNVLAAQAVLSADVDLGTDSAAEYLHSLQSGLADDEMPVRVPSSDDEVAEFVRTALERGDRRGRTALLREYRDSGRACEQKRFGQIYRKVEDECPGSLKF